MMRWALAVVVIFSFLVLSVKGSSNGSGTVALSSTMRFNVAFVKVLTQLLIL